MPLASEPGLCIDLARECQRHACAEIVHVTLEAAETVRANEQAAPPRRSCLEADPIYATQPSHGTTKVQTCADTSDQSRAFTLAGLHCLHRL
jgi:hypothetical protein